MQRLISFGLLPCGLVLLAAAGYLFFQESAFQPGSAIAINLPEPGPVNPATTIDYFLEVENPTSGAIRIVGLTWC